MVRTNHAALTWLQQFQEPEGQVATWLAQLQEFSFHTEYCPGKQHKMLMHCPGSHVPPMIMQMANVSIVLQGSESWALTWSSSELLQKLMADPVMGVILSWKE